MQSAATLGREIHHLKSYLIYNGPSRQLQILRFLQTDFHSVQPIYAYVYAYAYAYAYAGPSQSQ
jgi:hypothetical protein